MSREKQNPTEKAAENRSADRSGQSRAQSLHEWNDLVSGRIEEAMQQGAFDNLPGHGKPLNLRRNPYTPDEQQMAFNLLEDNNLAPDWIGDRKLLQSHIASLRSQIKRAVSQDRARWLNASAPERADLWRERQYYLRRWQATIDDLNKRIRTLNLKQPFVHLELLVLKLDDELVRLGADWLKDNAE